eukprot:2034674-Pyramimonas_sp.AAC.1
MRERERGGLRSRVVPGQPTLVNFLGTLSDASMVGEGHGRNRAADCSRTVGGVELASNDAG